MNGIPIELEYQNGYILCCQCGLEIEPNPSNMCITCIRTKIDISEGIPKQATLHFCKSCERYLQPPSDWVTATLESKELLTLCLQKLKGLSSVHLANAGFIFTEPHSKRLKVQLSIEAKIDGGAKIQQVFVVEYTVAYQMCDDCHRHEAQNFWRASVQVRQKSEYKKVIFYLEQIILKYKAHENTLGLKMVDGGLDFYYATESQARKLVDLLNSVLPIRYQHSKKLISHDIHSNIYNYKYSYSVEIVPLSKGSLVCLPKVLTQQLGGINPICLINKVTSTIQIIDPATSQIADISSTLFWRHQFNAICKPRELVQYTVMDIESMTIKRKPGQGKLSHKHLLADIWLVKTSLLGSDDNQIHTRTHIGHLLNIGDTVLCYDLTSNNINDTNFDKLKDENIPSLVLVKKYYERKSRRIWKLKHLNEGLGQEKENQSEFNEFMNDLEEDETLRTNINIYKDPKMLNQPQTAIDENEDNYDPDFPKITLAEMLDDLTIEDEDNDPMNEPAFSLFT